MGQDQIMKSYITNRYQSVKLPYSPEMLEWLLTTYPHSKYHVVGPAEPNTK
jgi:hypothetical protein